MKQWFLGKSQCWVSRAVRGGTEELKLFYSVSINEKDKQIA